jgi:predicted ATPase
MVKLKIKNIGPIKNGFNSNDGFINFTGVTLFVGNQGSGKSTVAKVFSTLSWIEKALVRGDFNANYLSSYNRFKKHLAYQGISNYLNNNSLIEYIGNAFTIKYYNSKLIITENTNKSGYKFPKIMYVPAERNFVSSVDRPDLVKRLPLPLYTFLDEYDEAKNNLRNEIKLPIGNVSFQYRKQNKKSWLLGHDFKIPLLEASSGFQSLVPLFIVTQHLTQIIKQSGDSTYKKISVDEGKKIRKEIDNIFSNENISEDIRRVLLEKLSARFEYACFLNIVEEPEQNLYPISQKEILFELLNSKNDFEHNKLIITTHSPYIINYLTLSIKADIVKHKINGNDNNHNRLKELSEVVPLGSTVDKSIVSIYQLSEHGDITRLSDYNGLPSDENYLNEFLAESNDMFIKLMEIEDQCQ